MQKQRARLQNGYWAFTPLKGYRKVKHSIHKKIDIQTDQAKYVKEALESFASMKFIYKVDGAVFLQEKGVISKKQTKEKATATFDRILRNVFYAGFIEFPEWEVERRTGHHERLIELDIYNKNLKRLETNTITFSRQTIREDFELRRLVNCVECGKEYTGAPSTSKTGKKHAYYKCQTKGCTFKGKSIKADTIHDEFKKLLKEVKPSQEVMDLAFTIFEDVWKETLSEQETLKKNNLKSKSEKQEQINSYLKEVIKTSSENVKIEYEKQIDILSQEIKNIDLEVAGLEEDKDLGVPYRTSWNELAQVLKNPLSVWENYTVVQKQRFYNFIFDGNLNYSKEYGYRTPKYALPVRIFEEISTGNTLSVRR